MHVAGAKLSGAAFRRTDKVGLVFIVQANSLKGFSKDPRWQAAMHLITLTD